VRIALNCRNRAVEQFAQIFRANEIWSFHNSFLWKMIFSKTNEKSVFKSFAKGAIMFQKYSSAFATIPALNIFCLQSPLKIPVQFRLI